MKDKLALFLLLMAVGAVFPATYYAQNLITYNSVLNASKVLYTGDYVYAQTVFNSNPVCPPGPAFSRNGSYCQFKNSIYRFNSWEMVNFSTLVSNAKNVSVGAYLSNSGCYGSGCSTQSEILVYVNPTGQIDSSTWSFLGYNTIYYGQYRVFNYSVSGNVSTVIVARGWGGDFRPDPSFDFVSVTK